MPLELIMLALAGVPATVAAAFSVSVWYRIGKINGTLATHEKDLDHIKASCPLYGHKTPEGEP